jgi:hypothetical protein
MTLLEPFQRHLHLQIQMIEKKRSIARWTQFFPMELERGLIDYMVVNPWVYKWVFKRKFRHDCTIDKYKARLMAICYTQKEGECCFNTYSPIVRLITIHVLLSLVASNGFLIHQIGIKKTFLNGEVEEKSI